MVSSQTRITGRQRRSRVRLTLERIVVETHCGISEVDVVTFCEFFQDVFPDFLSRSAAIPGLTEISNGEEHDAVGDAGTSIRLNWKMRMSITSLRCSPIWILSPTSNGLLTMMNSHPVRFTIGFWSATASPAERRPTNMEIDSKP